MKRKILITIITILVILIVCIKIVSGFKTTVQYYEQEPEVVNKKEDISTSKIINQNKEEKKNNNQENKDIKKEIKDDVKKENKKNANISNKVDNNSLKKSVTNKSSSTIKKESTNIKISISIDTLVLIKSPGKDKVDDNLKEFIPKNGYILSNIDIDVKKNASVYDVLIEASRKYGFSVEHSGSGSNLYIQSIGNISEFDAGSQSGWVYMVNNTFPNYGVGSYHLKNNDKIKFKYTTNRGKDVGNGY
jgi:hypothetical protein